MSVNICLRTTYHVTAYDASYASYGYNASRDFDDEASAVAYARKLRSGITPHGPQYEPIRVTKRITMEPIHVDIPF